MRETFQNMSPQMECDLAIRNFIERNAAKANHDVREACKRSDAEFSRFPTTIRALADLGWNASSRLPLDRIPYLNRLIGQPDDLNDAMFHIARAEFHSCAGELCTRWPKRTRILESAVSAHRRGDYALSALASFAQADGICRELLGKYMFSKHKNEPLAKNAIKAKLESENFRIAPRSAPVSIISAFVPFLVYLEIGSSLMRGERETPQKEVRDAGSQLLSRHAVMHGMDCEYISEANSLKSFMTVGYMDAIETELNRN